MNRPFGSDWTAADDVADINVVPLVDVLLVLLVIFMITAPIITHTLDVQLPKANLSSGARTQQTLIVSLDHKGTVAINDRIVGPLSRQDALNRFEREINRWQAQYRGNPAFLRADRRIRYGTVMQVMAHLRRLNVVDVGLMIEREGK